MPDYVNNCCTGCGAPVVNIIDTVLKVTPAGVHSVQQLYDNGQILRGLRKEQATQYAVNMRKLNVRGVKPEDGIIVMSQSSSATLIFNISIAHPVITPTQPQTVLPQVSQPEIV